MILLFNYHKSNVQLGVKGLCSQQATCNRYIYRMTIKKWGWVFCLGMEAIKCWERFSDLASIILIIKIPLSMFLALLWAHLPTYVSINRTVNQQKMPFSDPTHPPLCWRNTWMIPIGYWDLLFKKNSVICNGHINYVLHLINGSELE